MVTASNSRNEHGRLNIAQTYFMEWSSVQLNATGILYAKIVIDEFADELSLMEMRLGSSKARTTTSYENGPCVGPAASLEMMMQLDAAT